MKKKLNVVLGIMIMALLLATIFAGCAKEGEITKEQGNGETVDISQKDKEKEVTSDTEEPIIMTFHIPGTTDVQPDPENETNKLIIETIKENTGIEIKLEYYDFGETYRQKLNMFAASKEIPSGVWKFGGITDTFTTEILNKMGEAEILWDIDNYIEQYPNLKPNAEELFLQIARNENDGKLYIYPAERHRSFPHAPGGIAVRKDWLEQCSVNYPQDVDALYSMIRTFKENLRTDAEKEVAPVGFNNFVWMDLWLNSWLGSSSWTEVNGRYEVGKYSKVDQLKEALVFLNKLWRENLIDKESFTMKDELFIEKASNGTIGVSPHLMYSGTYNANDALQRKYPDSNKYFISIPPFAASDKISVDQVNAFELVSAPAASIVFTKDISEEHLDRYFKCIDYIGGYEGSVMTLLGFEDKEWERDSEGAIRRTEEYNRKVDIDNLYQWKSGLCVYSQLNPNPEALADLLNCIATRPADVESVKNIQGHQIALSLPIHIVATGEIESEKMPLIDKEWNEMFIKAVTEAKSEDECAKIVDEWPTTANKLGYQDVLKERNENADKIAN
jgi:putative aldouronate transport system substrate-binding protein